MAINFPSSPSNGEEYTDPNSGTWVYDSGTNSWTLTAGGSTSAFNFRGGHDFRSSTPPAAPIESGDMWIHDAPTGTIDAVYTGISGQIGNGQLVLWDGSNYVMVSGTVPGYPDVDDGEGGTLDSRYLKLGANAGAQTVATTETTTFNGTIHLPSSSVTQGRSNPTVGFNIDDANLANRTGIFGTGNGQVRIVGGSAINDGTRDLLSLGSIGTRLRTENASGTCYTFDGTITTASGGDNGTGLQVKADVAVPLTGIYRNIAATSTLTSAVAVAEFAYFDVAPLAANVNAGSTINVVYGYKTGTATAANLNATTVYGFYSDYSSAGGSQFNFYAAGSANNWFSGPVTGGGSDGASPNWQISPDGSTSPFNIQLQMESDDPASYQTTYATDDEGNQIENTTYIGESESLLAIIKDLRARVAALEAGNGGY